MNAGEARFAIEGVEILCLHDVEARRIDARLQVEHVIEGDAVVAGLEAAAPVIDAEGLGKSVGPDLDPAVGDDLQRQRRASVVPQPMAERLRLAVLPLQEDIDPDERLARRQIGRAHV